MLVFQTVNLPQFTCIRPNTLVENRPHFIAVFTHIFVQLREGENLS